VHRKYDVFVCNIHVVAHLAASLTLPPGVVVPLFALPSPIPATHTSVLLVLNEENGVIVQSSRIRGLFGLYN
jgi:hypothetical protein